MSVCHHHAPAVMPFCIAGKPIAPVFHIGATIGEETPFWDQHNEFGDTNLLVVKPEEGRSLARALERARRALDVHVSECRLSAARACARDAGLVASWGN